MRTLGRWAVIVAVMGAVLGDPPADARTGRVLNVFGAKGLIRSAREIVRAAVVDVSSGQSRGALNAKEIGDVVRVIEKSEAEKGPIVATAAPWDAVLVLTTRSGDRYVAQLFGDLALRVESPDPLARSKRKAGGNAPRSSDVFLGPDGRLVWQILERVLGPTNNQELLAAPPIRQGL